MKSLLNRMEDQIFVFAIEVLDVHPRSLSAGEQCVIQQYEQFIDAVFFFECYASRD
ncbi:hypothetical protein [Sinorhizobium meliloti]|uniref:hypothetical protein n=1 Tax=Rhizobium meliloti TaxID=382 RepID=UPI0013E38D3F|nr:hypothetical protein [Sinorhizobium meliloti]